MPFNDGFRHLRNQIEKPAVLCSPALNFCLKTPVISRTETSFLSEFPKHLLDSVSRRRKHHGTGLFTPLQQPYKVFGDMRHTDPFEWIAEYFGVSAPKAPLLYQGKAPYIHGDDINDSAVGVLFDNTICVTRTAKQKEQYPFSLQAGLSTIQLHLAANQRTIVEVQCGSCYITSSEREKNRQEQLKGRRISLSRDHTSPTGHIPNSDNHGTRKRIISPNPRTPKAAMHHEHAVKQFSQDTTTEETQDHLKQVCSIKLKTIYSLLCCIHNLKARDVRSKELLSPSILKTISKKPFSTLDKGLYSHQFLYHQFRRSSMHETRSLSGRSADTDFRGGSVSYHQINLGPTVGPLGQHTAKIVPAWQRQIVFIDTEEEERRNRDAETKLNDTYEAFQCCKNELAKQLRDRLKEREQIAKKQMLRKLTELKLGANPTEQLQRMRERVYLISRLEKNDLKDTRPKWYIMLEKEAMSLFSSEDGLEWRESLHNLQQFTVIDTENVPHAVEKLCLVVMSYPVHKLCTEPFIKAVKFTLEHVLKTSPYLMNHWLEIRRIPCITTLRGT